MLHALAVSLLGDLLNTKGVKAKIPGRGVTRAIGTIIASSSFN